MNRASIVIARQFPRTALLVIGVLLTLAAGCVYRPVIQQGNLLKVSDVDQVTIGMTRSQVRYLLGTPMVADPFLPDRWDYIYTLKRGRKSGLERSHFVVTFADDRVAKVEKLDAPDEVRAHGGKKAEPDAGHEPPPAPSVQQPQPDTPRPSGT